MKRKWTRGEKALFLAPILVGVAALALQIGPNAARKALGYPTELAATPGNSLTSISLSRDGRVLAAGEQINPQARIRTVKNIIYLWDARTLRPLPALTRPFSLTRSSLGKIKDFDDITWSVALSPDAKLLAWSDLRHRLTVCEVKTRRLLWSSNRFTKDIEFSSDGRFIATDQGGIRLYDARSGTVVASWQIGPNSGEIALKFSPKGRYFASTGGRPPYEKWIEAPNQSGGEIELRRVADWKIQRVLPLTNADKIAFSPDERTLIGVANLRTTDGLGYDGSRLRCFDVSSGQVKWELNSRDKAANPQLRFLIDACFSPDGATVAILTGGREVFLLNAQTGATIKTLRVPVAQPWNCFLPNGLAFSPDSKRLFARGKDAVLVWDLN